MDFEQRNPKMEMNFYTNTQMNNNFVHFNTNFPFNYEMINVEREVKMEEAYNLLPALWNFDDFFTI
jgi:hypothetical protein